MSNIYINPTLYTARPKSQGRLPAEMAVYDLLERLEIPFVRIDHEATATIEDCQGVDALLGIHICKNLFLCNAGKTRFYLLMMPGDKQFKTKELSRQINSSRLSFASPEFMTEFLGLTPGSVSILGLMNDTNHRVQLVIDKEVAAEPYIGCHPCINTSSLRLLTSDVLNRLLPAIGHEPFYVDL